MARWLALVPVLLLFCGCSSNEPLRLAQTPHQVATWVRPAVKRTQAKSDVSKPVASDRETELAALPKNSPEWWALHDAIEAEDNTRLTKIMVICKGCLDAIGNDSAGSKEKRKVSSVFH